MMRRALLLGIVISLFAGTALGQRPGSDEVDPASKAAAPFGTSSLPALGLGAILGVGAMSGILLMRQRRARTQEPPASQDAPVPPETPPHGLPKENPEPATKAPRMVSITTEATTADDMLREGRTLVREGRHAEASAWFRRARIEDPAVPIAHYCEGLCLLEMGRPEDAYTALLTACMLDPSDGEVRVTLARACALTGRSTEALDALAPVLAAYPEGAPMLAEDESFRGLQDHPLFLQMVGRL